MASERLKCIHLFEDCRGIFETLLLHRALGFNGVIQPYLRSWAIRCSASVMNATSSSERRRYSSTAPAVIVW